MKTEQQANNTIETLHSSVPFPFPPYAQQEKLVSVLMLGLQHSQNVLVESPTGTGKTLCLLAASLSWLTSYAEWTKLRLSLQVDRLNPKDTLQKDRLQILKTLHTQTFGARSFNIQTDQHLKNPRVFYASRTHSQLSQVVQQVKSTGYAPTTRVLGSRDQMCINPEVTSQNNATRTALCKAKVTKSQCEFHTNSQSLHRQHDMKSKIMDIEDLVKYGVEHKACPFYLSKDTQAGADLILLPYNYLIDKAARKSQSIDLENAIVIFDEGHNLESSCNEATSFEISTRDLQNAIKEAEMCLHVLNITQKSKYQTLTAQDIENVIETLGKFIKVIESQILAKLTKDLIKPSEYIIVILEQVGINSLNHIRMDEIIKECIKLLASSKDNGKNRKQLSLSQFRSSISLCFSLGLDSSKVSKYFKLHIQSSELVQEDKEGMPRVVEELVLSLWCFNSGVAMNDLLLQGVRSVIIASGTLSPLNSFATEMGLEFPNRLENTHVISPSQIYVGVVPKGPNNHVLSSIYNLRDSREYILDLGNTIANLARIVPDGLLVFFTSYNALLKSTKEWQTPNGLGQTIWDRIIREKQIFIEPKNKLDFTSAIQAYEKAISANKGGAVFFAVCRGKASEGIDFSDKKARAVVICGIPYPFSRDAKVMLKRKILEDERNGAGQEWYTQQAARAVNQAIGRVIRHCKDFGAILLCDERFTQPHVVKQLPVWVRPFVNPEKLFGKTQSNLVTFFKTMRDSKGVFPVAFDPLLSVKDNGTTRDVLASNNRVKSITTKDFEASDPLRPLILQRNGNTHIPCCKQDPLQMSNCIDPLRVDDRVLAYINQRKTIDALVMPPDDVFNNSSKRRKMSIEATAETKQKSMAFNQLAKSTLTKAEYREFQQLLRDYKTKSKTPYVVIGNVFDLLAPSPLDCQQRRSDCLKLLIDFKMFIGGRNYTIYDSFMIVKKDMFLI